MVYKDLLQRTDLTMLHKLLICIVDDADRYKGGMIRNHTQIARELGVHRDTAIANVKKLLKDGLLIETEGILHVCEQYSTVGESDTSGVGKPDTTVGKSDTSTVGNSDKKCRRIRHPLSENPTKSAGFSDTLKDKTEYRQQTGAPPPPSAPASPESAAAVKKSLEEIGLDEDFISEVADAWPHGRLLQLAAICREKRPLNPGGWFRSSLRNGWHEVTEEPENHEPPSYRSSDYLRAILMELCAVDDDEKREIRNILSGIAAEHGEEGCRHALRTAEWAGRKAADSIQTWKQYARPAEQRESVA